MPKQSLFPVIITKQLNTAVYAKANGRYYGYNTLNYSLVGTDITHSVALEGDEVVITDFPEGAGRYRVWLGAPGGAQSPTIEFYYTRDSDKAVFQKILSYLHDCEDENFVKSLVSKINSTQVSYTHQILKEFSKIKSPSDYELISFYQLINVAEHFENAMIMAANRGYLSKMICHYAPDFLITPSASITNMNVFVYDGDEPNFVYVQKVGPGDIRPLFAPGHFYRMDFYSGPEFVVSLYHYQLSEAGLAYLWEQSKHSDATIEMEMMDDAELAHTGIELTHEDKQRIIEERSSTPRGIMVDRPEIIPGALDPSILIVTIPDYDMLAASADDYYLSVVESDLGIDANFDLRFLINSSVMKIDTRQSMLDDEIIVCVKDSSGIVVSKFARYSISDDDDYIEEYCEKRHLVELAEYTKQLLDGFTEVFGAGEVYNVFADIVLPLCTDESKSLRDVFDAIILGILKNQRIAGERDNILFFVEDNWMKLGLYDSAFFPESPVFYYAENRLTFPNNRADYVVCVERYDAFNNMAYREYVSSDSDSGVSVQINNIDFCCVYAVDVNSHKTSGRVFFNNLGRHTYYRDQMDMEVIIYHGRYN